MASDQSSPQATDSSANSPNSVNQFSAATEVGATKSAPTCGCHGGQNGSSHSTEAASAPASDGSPVLDARAIPHTIRHATILGAVDNTPSGSSLILVAPHDPKPLLNQLGARDDRITVDYEISGPDAWRLRLTRYDD